MPPETDDKTDDKKLTTPAKEAPAAEVPAAKAPTKRKAVKMVSQAKHIDLLAEHEALKVKYATLVSAANAVCRNPGSFNSDDVTVRVLATAALA